MKYALGINRLKLLLYIVFILVVAQAFNGGLSVSSLEKLYFKSLIASYEVVGNDLRKNILSALRFGKSLEKFVGIRDLLEETKRNIPDLHNVNVVSRSGKILYSLDQSLVGKNWRDIVGKKGKDDHITTGEGVYTVKTDGIVYTVLSLKPKKGLWKGTIALSFEEGVINQRIMAEIKDNLKILGLTLGLATLLLGVLLLTFIKKDRNIREQKKRLYAIIIVVLVGAQLAYSFFNVKQFQDSYVDISRKNAVTLSKLLKDDIEYLFSKGLSIRRLFKVDVLLYEIVKATPEISDIGILDADNHVRYHADKEGASKAKKDEAILDDREISDYYDVIVPLYKVHKQDGKSRFLMKSKTDTAEKAAEAEEPEKKLEGYIRIHLSEKVIGQKVHEIRLDSGTVVLISFLFVIELLILLFIFIQREVADSLDEGEAARQVGDWGMMRPVIFIYLMAMSLSQSFIPLQMQVLYEPMWGLSRDIILGLPISVEMLAAGVSLIPVGIWMDRRGWHEPFFVGIALSIGGACLSGLATDALLFIGARAVAGVGYGLTWIASQGFVFNYTTSTTRARGLSNLVAGIFAGQICGASVGGMLAERLGFTPIFFVSMTMVSLVLIIALLFLRSYCRKPESKGDILSLRQVARYLFDRRTSAVLWLSVVPMSMCIVGILFYLSPIYLKSIGSTQSDIGRALMIFGFCAIYLAPVISKYVDKSRSKKAFIFASGVIGGLGLLVFEYYSGLWAMLFAISMLGLASSVGVAAQTVFALGGKAAQEIGTGKALSIQRTIDKLGQMLGPILLGGMIAAVDIQLGLAFVGILYMLTAFLFLLVAGPED